MLKESLRNLHLFAQTLSSANTGNIEDWRLLNLKEQEKKDSEINYQWNSLKVQDDIDHTKNWGGCLESGGDIYENWKNTSTQDIENNHKKKIRDKDDWLAYHDIERHLILDVFTKGHCSPVVMNLDKIYNDPQISEEKKRLIEQKINITTTENGKTRVIRPGDHITGTGKKSDSEMLKMLKLRKEHTSDIKVLQEEWKQYIKENDPLVEEKKGLWSIEYPPLKPHIMSSVLWRYWFETGLIDTDIYYGGATADGKYIYTLYIRKFNTIDNNRYLEGEFDYRQIQLPMVFLSNIRPDAKGFEKLLLQTLGIQTYYEFNFHSKHDDVFSSKMSYNAKDNHKFASDSHVDVYHPSHEINSFWMNSWSQRMERVRLKKKIFTYFDRITWCNMTNLNKNDARLDWPNFPLMVKPRYETIIIPIRKLSKQTLKMNFRKSEPSYLESFLERWFGFKISKFEASFNLEAGVLLEAVKEKFKDNPRTFLLLNHYTTIRQWITVFLQKSNFDIKIIPKFKGIPFRKEKTRTYEMPLFKIDWIKEKANTSFKRQMFSAPYEWLKNGKENMGYYQETELDILRANLLSSNNDLTVGISEIDDQYFSDIAEQDLEVEDLYFEIDVLVADLFTI